MPHLFVIFAIKSAMLSLQSFLPGVIIAKKGVSVKVVAFKLSGGKRGSVAGDPGSWIGAARLWIWRCFMIEW
jgi:hypothetical protein